MYVFCLCVCAAALPSGQDTDVVIIQRPGFDFWYGD